MPLVEVEVGPSDELTWGINWTKWLDGRTIADSVWTVNPPAALLNQSFTTTRSLAKLRLNGNIGDYVEVSNQITTSDGEVETRRLAYKIVNR